MATASRSSSNRSAYVSSVIAAEACPSIRWTAFTFAPAEIARDAAVCRRSCGVSRGTPERATAPANHPRVLLGMKLPSGAGKTSAVGDLSLRLAQACFEQLGKWHGASLVALG